MDRPKGNRNERDSCPSPEDIFPSSALPRIGIVPLTEDAPALWDAWVAEGGGEGIVLKDPAAVYRPGLRSPAWLKVKAKLTLDVIVTGGDPTPITVEVSAGHRAPPPTSASPIANAMFAAA